MPRIHGIPFREPVHPIHAFVGTDPLCAECQDRKLAHEPGERPLQIAGVRCVRCARRGESMVVSALPRIADQRDLLAEARTMRRDPANYYHGADVAIRLDAAAAIRRTLRPAA